MIKLTPERPPYYEIIPTAPLSGGINRLYANTTHVPTVSTTETDFYIFMIPANTLQNTGDAVTIIIILTTAGADTYTTSLYLNDVLANQLSTTATGGQQIQLEIIRTGTTTAQINYNKAYDAELEIQFQTQTGLDFTIANEIKFTGQSATGTTLTARGVTMDKNTI